MFSHDEDCIFQKQVKEENCRLLLSHFILLDMSHLLLPYLLKIVKNPFPVAYWVTSLFESVCG